jgi:drug/metabolite transporter superfamily protein YnfA
VSYAGIAPLVLCLLGVGLLPGFQERELAQRIAIAYGAVVLAFTGAVHWGLALAGQLPWRPLRIGGAVLPALIGATAAVLGGQRGLALLVVGFGAFWLYEHRSAGAELPAAYVSLRRNLSLVLCALLALTMILSDAAGLS